MSVEPIESCWSCGHWALGSGCFENSDTPRSTEHDFHCNEWVKEGTAGTISAAGEAESDEPTRKCGVCNKPMTEGFVEEETGRLWCDEPCLRNDFTEQEQKQAYSDDGGGLYWTEWEDELEERE